MLTLPNFERLKIFHAVHLNQSIQKAADSLNVTRSAVSQSLKKLEEEIGAKLFIRDSKNFKANNYGEDLFKTIEPFISELNVSLQRLESGLKTPTGILRIGAPMDLGSNQLTASIGQFKKLYPAIQFQIELGVPVKLLEKLIDGKLDLAFIDNGDIHTSNYPVSIQPYMKEEFVLVVSKDFFKTYKLNDLSYEKLAKLPVVDYLPHAPVTRLWFKHHFAKEPNSLNVHFSAESVRAVLNAVASDIGAGVIPHRLITGEFEQLKVIPTAKGRFINEIVIARRLGQKASFKEKEFIRFCRENTNE